MAIFEVQAPDGQVYEIDAPDQQQALQAFQGFMSQQQAPAPTPQPTPQQPVAAPEVTAPAAPAAPPTKPQRGFGETLYENIIGSGDIDTPGERLGAGIRDVAQAGAAGLVRGAAALGDIPGDIGRLIGSGAEATANALGVNPSFAAGLSAGVSGGLPPSARQGLAELSGGATEFRGETTPGQFAGTVGEFLPGAAAFGGGGAANLLRYGVAPGVASEAAGQLTEGTAIEPAARVVGALVAPSAVNFGTRKFQTLVNKTATAPSVQNLKAAKNEAYKAADEANITFGQGDMRRIVSRAAKALDDANYVPDVDLQTKAAFATLEKFANKPATLGQLDKLRQGLWRRLNADKSQVAISDMIDAIDDTILRSTQGGDLMRAARLANSRFKKSELLEDALTKAADQTAATGSGGNIANKYRQAVTQIINNPKKARFFSTEEIENMRSFVRGSQAENILRATGKLAPGGNGLMTALNVGAAAANPAFLAVSGASSLAKSAADRKVIEGARKLQEMLATGRVPQAATPQPGSIGLAGGLTAQVEGQ